MKSAWLLRGGDVLASAEVAESLAERVRGLAGRRGFDGAILLTNWRGAHGCGVPFAIDVAFLDDHMVVVSVTRLRPWSTAMPRRGACHVLEAPSGAFERWRLQPGDKIEIRETG